MERERQISERLAVDLARNERPDSDPDLAKLREQRRQVQQAENTKVREAREAAEQAERDRLVKELHERDEAKLMVQLRDAFFASNPSATDTNYERVKTRLREEHMARESLRDP